MSGGWGFAPDPIITWLNISHLLCCLQYASIVLKYAVLDMFTDCIILRRVRTESYYSGGMTSHLQGPTAQS